MKTINLFFKASALISAMLIGCASAYAQSYYDDDIYFDASKASKEKLSKEAAKTPSNAPAPHYAAGSSGQYYYDGAAYVPWNNVGDYLPADTYMVNGTSTRDVDEYNRRSTTTQPQKELCDSITLQEFEAMSEGGNTRNLARFHNSQVASDAYTNNGVDSPDYYINSDGSTYTGTSDSYYYTSAQPSSTVVNLNVVGGYPYYWGSPWYGGYYSPWYGWGYNPWWGPSWSWTWGGPSWSWSWGWGGPAYAWGPGWGGIHHHPGWGGHVRPTYTSSGAYRPNGVRPTGSATYRNRGVYRSQSANGNRGSVYNSNGYRPSGNTAGQGASRPGYRAPIGTPNRGSATAPSGSSSWRGYSSPNGGNTNRGSYNNSSNSYRPSGNSGSFRSNSGSGGSRGGFSSGGGSRSGGGGGGHRGR